MLEVLALLINERRITAVAEGFASKFIIEVLAWTETSDELKALVADAVTQKETYAELQTFRRRHQNEISHLVPIYRARGTQS